MTHSSEITARSWLMIAVLGLTWGGTFLFIEMALDGITPFWLAAGRIGFAALLMSAVWTLRGRQLFEHRPSSGVVALLIAVGLLSSAVPFMFLNWGQQYVTSGFAGVSMAAVALIVLPLAHFLIPGERMTWRRVTGMVIGFVGVTILIGAQAFESSGESLEFAGRMACLGTGTCYALSSVLMRRLPAIDPIGLASVAMLMGACVVIPVAWLVEGPPPMLSGRTLAIVAFLGLVPTAAANVLRVLVIRQAGPVFMSLVNYQVPVWSVLLGAAILSEPLPPSLIYALALILAGVALSQYGALRRLFGRG